jgi:hypothetical protein
MTARNAGRSPKRLAGAAKITLACPVLNQKSHVQNQKSDAGIEKLAAGEIRACQRVNSLILSPQQRFLI